MDMAVEGFILAGDLTSQVGVSPGVQCKVVVESNHFISNSEPIHQLTAGVTEVRGSNIIENTTGDTISYGGTAFVPPTHISDVVVS